MAWAPAQSCWLDLEGRRPPEQWIVLTDPSPGGAEVDILGTVTRLLVKLNGAAKLLSSRGADDIDIERPWCNNGLRSLLPHYGSTSENIFSASAGQ